MKKEKRKRRRRLRLARDRRVEAFGIALITFGVFVSVLTWAGMRTATNVAYQLPLLASGGLAALGCYIVGGLLLAGGIVMTRFTRLDNARRQPAGNGAEALRLFEEPSEASHPEQSRRRWRRGRRRPAETGRPAGSP